MFDRFRKPVRKPQPYRLHLTPLEARDVPATWHVEATSAADAIVHAVAGGVNVSYLGQTHLRIRAAHRVAVRHSKSS